MSTVSRASTSELLTPTISDCELPVVPTEKSINNWLSEIPIDLFDPMYQNGPREELVQLSSESTAYGPCLSIPKSVCDCTQLVMQDADKFSDDMLNILSQLDFSLPPAASLDGGSCQEGPLWVEGSVAFDSGSSRETDCGMFSVLNRRDDLA